MTISWANLMAMDRETKFSNADANAGVNTECVSGMVSMITSLIFQ